MADFAKSNRDHVGKLHVAGLWDLYGTGQHNSRMQKDAVDPEAPSFVIGDRVSNFEGGPAVGARRGGKAGLIGRIVGNFRLIEESAAMVAVPKDLELLMVLDEEAVDSNVVAVDDQAVLAEVFGPRPVLNLQLPSDLRRYQ